MIIRSQDKEKAMQVLDTLCLEIRTDKSFYQMSQNEEVKPNEN